MASNLQNDLYIAGAMAPELARVIYWTKTKTGNIVDTFEKHSQKWPTKECIVMGEDSYTFEDINRISGRMANWLLDKGVKPKDIVAMVFENSPEFIYTWLAINKIGGVAAFINTNLQNKALAHCLTISNCVMVMYHSTLAGNVQPVASSITINGQPLKTAVFGTQGQAGDITPEILAELGDTPIPSSLKSEISIAEPAILIYTSGTTGMPKAAIVSHARHYLGGCIFTAAYRVRNDDRIYCCLPLYHSSAAIIGMSTCFRTGATIILARKFSASNFWNDCIKHKATVFQYIGELCRYLLNQPEKETDRQHNIRLAIGNGLRPDIWMPFRERFALSEIGEFYSSTEGNVYLFNRNLGADGAGAVGRTGLLLRSVTATRLIKLDMDTEQPIRNAKDLCVQCGYDEAGELIGEVVPGDPRKDFKGYHNDSGSTNKKILHDVFKKGDMWFRTGDVLKLTRDGYWYFVDRIGDTFRWKGENVSTNEVQEAFHTFPDVLSSNVYGVAIVGHDGKAGMASLTVSDPSNFAVTGLSQHLHQLLPKYAVPIFVRVLKGEMEETATLKVIKGSAKTVGFDISKYHDQVWWRPGALGFPSSNDEFVPFTLDDLKALQTGADPKSRV
ncbi:hypothetical protein HDU85_001711 [Gaertneriomyces sp. JEL0708]|nr:hypothetical protein HDU85_001711 [Gaertneriomyces sp. JEL0708]